jgi:hypothetical protein
MRSYSNSDKDTDKGVYLGESFHHTRQRPGKVAISDGQSGTGTSKRKSMHHIRLGIRGRDQEDEIIRTILLDTEGSTI